MSLIRLKTYFYKHCRSFSLIWNYRNFYFSLQKDNTLINKLYCKKASLAKNKKQSPTCEVIDRACKMSLLFSLSFNIARHKIES